MFRRWSVLSGVSRGTRMSLRRSFRATSAARETRSSEVPAAIRASVPIEQGMMTVASHTAEPLANGAFIVRGLNAFTCAAFSPSSLTTALPPEPGSTPISCFMTSRPRAEKTA
jgi:hypothetical protein